MLEGSDTAMDEPIIGEIRLAANDRIPAGWAACDGQVLAISEYRALYDVIGNRYGGDGRRTFALPDLRGRVAVHADATFPLGTKGGSASHALKVDELPPHSHDLLLSPVAERGGGDGVHVVTGSQDGIVEWSTGNAGGAASGHDNMQPYLGLVFMIAIVGQSPARN